MNNEIWMWVISGANALLACILNKYWQYQNEQKDKQIAELESKLELCKELLKERMI